MLSLPTRMCAFPSGPISDVSIVTVKMAWEREERSFMFVRPVTRWRLPACSTASISSTEVTHTPATEARHAVSKPIVSGSLRMQRGIATDVHAATGGMTHP